MSFSDLVNSYKTRLSIDGLTIRDEYINSIKDSFTDSFDNNVSYKEVSYKKRNETEYTTGFKVHVFQVKKDTEKVELDGFKRIVFKDLDFVCESGDLLQFGGYDWLVTSTNNIDHIKSCVVQQCGGTFIFVKNHMNYTVPYLLSTSGQGMGLDADTMKYISTISNFIFMRISDNDVNRLLEINDVIKLGRRSYKIMSDSDIINNGILIFKLEVVVEDAKSHIFTVDILNGDVNIQNGTTLQLNVNVLDNGEIISPTPTITYVSSDITKATVNNSGLITGISEGSCVISTTSNGVSDTINISVVSSVQDNITYTLTSVSQPDSEIKYGVTKQFVARKFNNGIEVTGIQFNFEVIATSVPSSAYTLNIIDTKSCAIKCNQYVYNIVLRATENATSNFIEKAIKLRSPL